MRTMLLWTIAMIVLAGGAVSAWGDLCDACAEKVYDTAIGKCAVCGGQTPSTGMKICEACSKKLGQCEACRVKLKNAATRPATQATTKPATRNGK